MIDLTSAQVATIEKLVLACRSGSLTTPRFVTNILRTLDPELATDDSVDMAFVEAAQSAGEPDPDRMHDYDR